MGHQRWSRFATAFTIPSGESDSITSQEEEDRDVEFWSLFAPIRPSFVGGHRCRVGGSIDRGLRRGNANASATEARRGSETGRAGGGRNDRAGTRANHRARRACAKASRSRDKTR